MHACEIEIRLQPRARSDEIVGEREGRLLVRVSAPPADGRANEALCRLLARRARVGRRSVSIVSGGRSRVKRVRVEGITMPELRRALGLEPSR